MTLTNTETGATEAEVADYLVATQEGDRAAAQAVMDKAIRTRIARARKSFDASYVQQLRGEAAKYRTDLREAAAEVSRLHLLVTKLSAENNRLKDTAAEASWPVFEAEKEIRQLRAAIERRDQTINALRVQLAERGQ